MSYIRFMKSEGSQKRQVNFFLSKNLLKHLQQYVPKGKQSQFAEQALDGALSSLRFQEALKSGFGAWKDHPLDTEKFIRSMRKSNRNFT